MSNNMVINTNEQATRIHGMYNRSVGNMNAAMTRIATAQKINSAKDNASVWAISQKMRERMRANDQANQNVQNDSALLKTAQGGLDNTLDILNTLKERAVNAANDSNVSGDRAKIAEEVRQLVMQIDENANKVKFNGRVLLNGAGETGATASNATGTISANAVTATGNYGNMAVYGLTDLSLGSSSAVASNSSLTSLVGKNGETLFQEGDTVTFRWTENGVAKQESIGVSSSTAVSDLKATGITGTWAAAGAAIGSASDANDNALKAGAASWYFTGGDQKNISDFSISVTTSTGATRAAAQEAMEPVAIQQSYGNTGQGSNVVYSMDSVTPGRTGTALVLAGDQTQLYMLDASTSTATSSYTIKINDTELKFSGGSTLAKVSNAFKEKGIDVELQFTQYAKDPLTYEGNTVTQGTYGSTSVYTGAEANQLHFVAAPGQNISYISFGSSTTGSSFSAAKTTASGISAKLALDTTGTAGGTSGAGTLPQGQALQFFVGGEQNFGVNFSIGKATAGNLLGGSADQFANKFLTKEGANSAIGIIDNAISKTLTEQTRLGAMEARLGYTSDNLTTMNDNLESGVSAYIDSDMAKEMTDYMKYAVVSQAAQYMLANAGQNSYNVLQLLQP